MKTIPIQGQKDKAQTVLLLCICVALSLFLQAAKFSIFPDKYFYDASIVQGMMQENVQFGFSDSYANTALLFQALNVLFPMNSQLWGGIAVWAMALPFFIWSQRGNITCFSVCTVCCFQYLFGTRIKRHCSFSFFCLLLWLPCAAKKEAQRQMCCWWHYF